MLLLDRKANFNILDFSKFVPNNTEVWATINQYPAHLDEYVKLSGPIYHANGKGIHSISTLPGSSGSGIIVNNKVAGVHVAGGGPAPIGYTGVFYNRNDAFNSNNKFELISLDEIERAGEHARRINNAELAILIEEYVELLKKGSEEYQWRNIIVGGVVTTVVACLGLYGCYRYGHRPPPQHTN